MVHFQLKVVDIDSSVRINGSVHSEAEDILHRLIRGFGGVSCIAKNRQFRVIQSKFITKCFSVNNLLFLLDNLILILINK